MASKFFPTSANSNSGTPIYFITFITILTKSIMIRTYNISFSYKEYEKTEELDPEDL